MKPDLRNCLTIKQPWASLIIRPDLPAGSPERKAWLASKLRKDIENRTWGTSYRGLLYIHAGKQYDLPGHHTLCVHFPELQKVLEDETGAPIKPQHSGIIGTVRIVDVVKYSPSLWFAGPIGWVLEDPQPVEFEPMRGALGLWKAGDMLPNPLAKNPVDGESAP